MRDAYPVSDHHAFNSGISLVVALTVFSIGVIGCATDAANPIEPNITGISTPAHANGQENNAIIVSTSAELTAALAPENVQAQTLMVWGDNASSQISGAPVGKVKAIADGGSINGLALQWDGTPILWGSGPIGPPAVPEALANEKFHAAALGRDDAVLIRPDGTLAAFGKNAPVTSVPSGTYHAVAVAAVHAVAIRDDGTLTTWGSDTYTLPNGDVGRGLLHAPEGGPFTEVSARVLYSLALHEDGTVYFWGRAPTGNFLDGWTAMPEDPQIFYFPGETFKAISAGNRHALASRTDGTVTGWGDGTGGALQPPAHVRFKAVAAGWGFSIGLDTDGTLWGWGTPVKSPFAAQAWTFASQGWTRYGDSEHYYIPGERFKSIAAAAFHIMAITAGP